MAFLNEHFHVAKKMVNEKAQFVLRQMIYTRMRDIISHLFTFLHNTVKMS